MGLVEQSEKAGLGVKFDGRWCGALLFTDDITILMAESEEKLQRMLDMVGKYARKLVDIHSSNHFCRQFDLVMVEPES